MQFTATFATLAFTVFAALITQSSATPAPVANTMSDDEFNHWLATTDAELTFIGKLVNGSVPRDTQDVMVTYCTSRTQNVCGGSCTAYNGPATCLSTPGTACLTASANVGFCDHGGCGGSCNEFSSCGTRLDNNFCATPGTASINVPPS